MTKITGKYDTLFRTLTNVRTNIRRFSPKDKKKMIEIKKLLDEVKAVRRSLRKDSKKRFSFKSTTLL